MSPRKAAAKKKSPVMPLDEALEYVAKDPMGKQILPLSRYQEPCYESSCRSP